MQNATFSRCLYANGNALFSNAILSENDIGKATSELEAPETKADRLVQPCPS